MAAKRCAILAIVALALALALVPAALCQKAAPAPTAATPAAPNITAVLEKGGQYTSFMRLMKSTQQDTQLNAQANNSDTGFTVFAPTDDAFKNLKPGTLNSLTQQEQVSLVQAHILPTFYSLESFVTASNPVRTQASVGQGTIDVNVTATSNSAVNVSTGLVSTMLGTALKDTKPLAVYSVDKVLLPYALFGPKPPAAAPTAKGKSPSSSAAKGGAAPSESEEAKPAGAAAAVRAGWGFAALLSAAAVCIL